MLYNLYIFENKIFNRLPEIVRNWNYVHGFVISFKMKSRILSVYKKDSTMST